MRRSLSIEKRVAIALWRLSTNADYRTIGHLFGVAKGTACVVANEVCCTVVERLFKKYVKIPVGKHFDDIVEGFERKWGFPQCAGAIESKIFYSTTSSSSIFAIVALAGFIPCRCLCAH